MTNDSVCTAADGSRENLPSPPTEPHPLDNPARASLLGPHAHFAEGHGQVLRYPAQMCAFTALPDEPDAASWRDVATLLGPGGLATLAATQVLPPPDWELVFSIAAVQLVDDGVAAAEDSEAIPLGPDAVPEMIALVELTKPGPFLPRTIELGSYRGIRRDGALVAMAGERLHPPGWTEVSAVCTHPDYRGQGFASRLTHAVVAGIRARGERPFLHASAANTSAIRLYQALGFRLRNRVHFRVARVPAGEAVT
jgi:ribosomal protein S18 acetylase RimI-like enzyme